MKKYIAALSLGTYLSLVTPAFASGSLCPNSASGFAGLCNINLSTLVAQSINLIFILAVVVALFYLIYGGFRWLTSGGDKQAVAAARDHIVAAIIGLVVIFLSYFVLNFLLTFFLGSGFGISNFSLPVL